MSERVSDYDYEHPDESVAQVPAERRQDARLLVVGRHSVQSAGGLLMRDGRVPDLRRLLRPGDLLVLNDTWVAPARLVARRDTGGRVDVLVLEATGRGGLVLLGARGSLRPGEELDVAGDRWRLVAGQGSGRFVVEVVAGRALTELLAAAGRMPLPPYIRRAADDPRDELDRRRYQTTFARQRDGARPAVAAPTAGLHLTHGLLEQLRLEGVVVDSLRLDVGLGTFQPLRGDTLDQHEMHAEQFEVSAGLAERFAATRRAGGRVVAVGTTVVRALETVVAGDGASLRPGAGQTRLFLKPGAEFRAVDALLTNFHQPRSTLLVLVSAFAGRTTIGAAYRHAIDAGYRLFSYGDAMFLADAAQVEWQP